MRNAHDSENDGPLPKSAGKRRRQPVKSAIATKVSTYSSKLNRYLPLCIEGKRIRLLRFFLRVQGISVREKQILLFCKA